MLVTFASNRSEWSTTPSSDLGKPALSRAASGRSAPIRIDTERLIIRSFRTDDLDAYAAVVADPDVMQFLGGVLSRKQAKAYIERSIDHERCLGFGRYAVTLKTSRAFIGMCGFAPIGGCVDLGYRFSKTFWGRGFATESATAVLDYGFDQLGFEEVVASALVDNEASLRVISKLGFSFAGIEPTEAGYPSRRHVLRKSERND